MQADVYGFVKSFEGKGSSSPETPAAFGLTGARTFGVGSSFLASLVPLITALSFNFDHVALSMANIAKIIREHPHLRPQIKAIMSRKYLDQKQSILEIQQLLHNAFGPAAAERTDAQAAEAPVKAPVGETAPVKAASVLGALSRGAPRAPAAAVLPVQDPLSTYAEVDAIAPGPPAEISMVTESGRRRSRVLEHVSIKGRASTSSFASTCTASTTSTTSTRI